MRTNFYAGPLPTAIDRPVCACGCKFPHYYRVFAVKNKFVYWFVDEGHKTTWEGQYSLPL